MKSKYLILTVSAIASICVLQIGCHEEAEIAVGSKSESTASSKAAIGPAVVETAPASKEPALEAKESRGAEITFEKLIHNFGEIGQGTKNVCEFKFANTGDSLLKIKKVSKTCGCTPYTLDKKNYAPGEDGTLKVRYNAVKRPASIKKSLYVHSNDKENPKVTLTIKAKIIQKVAHEPKKLNLFLKKENAGCPEIRLSSRDGQPFSIKGFKSTGRSQSTKGCITADIDSSVKATEFALQPKVNMEKLRKGLRGEIEISLNHPKCKLVTIPFNTLPEFKLSPRSITIHGAEVEKPVTREVWILNNYDEDFEVESVSSKKGVIKVLNQERIDNRYKFELEITPPAIEGGKRIFSDVFFVNIKDGERLKIICRGFYSKKAEKKD